MIDLIILYLWHEVFSIITEEHNEIVSSLNFTFTEVIFAFVVFNLESYDEIFIVFDFSQVFVSLYDNLLFMFSFPSSEDNLVIAKGWIFLKSMSNSNAFNITIEGWDETTLWVEITTDYA